MARILVVEDDPAQRFLFIQLLRRIGYDAIGASDAPSAISTLTSGTPIDAILTDLNMPGVHGLALIHALKLTAPDLPIVTMSVRSSKDWNLDVTAEDVLFLQKPFDRDTLAYALYAALSGHGKLAR